MAAREVLRRISAACEREVAELWSRHEADQIGQRRFVELAAAVIARHRQRAVSTADLAMAVQLSRLLGEQIPPLTVPPREGEQSRLRKAVSTVLAERIVTAADEADLAESQAARLSRLARSEPLEGAQETMQVALRQRDLRWTRATGADPCPLCTSLDDGTTLPASVPMATHPGCSCVQQPVR